MPELNPDYLIAGADQTVQVKGREVAGAWKLEAEMKEFCENYLNGYDVLAGNHTGLSFRFEDNRLENEGAEITGTEWSDQSR
mgnify:FL=1